jgi:alpha-tubulin suppressor-like RCC1 family protein
MGWGGNRFSQAKVPTNLVDVKSISAGCNYSMAMMNDGTVFGWGRNENNQVTIPKGITNAFSIGAGYVNSVISLRDGRVIVIGAPENDALITRTPTKTATPTP